MAFTGLHNQYANNLSLTRAIKADGFAQQAAAAHLQPPGSTSGQSPATGG
jgi:hypothetical protein